MTGYADYLRAKTQAHVGAGFAPLWLPDALFPFQRDLTDWAVRRGRAALFVDCGLGKTPMQLVWAENVVRHTNRPVLVLVPLAVAAQTVREGEKFGVTVRRIAAGGPRSAEVYVTNYEKLHHLDPADWAGAVCDESGCIKDFGAGRTGAVTRFLRRLPYRLLCTATPSPNDYVELGTSSEALGELGRMDMLAKFFKSDNGTLHPYARDLFTHARKGSVWRFKGHAEPHFWRWVCSWARACRKPSDLGHDDGPFVLPPLHLRETVVAAARPRPGCLFDTAAVTLAEQREERKRTIPERCEAVARLLADAPAEPAAVWAHLNAEADLLEDLIPGAVQVSGADPDGAKEEKFLAFQSGQARVVVTKPKIGAWGLNWQHCNRVVEFASHSFEQHYQLVRRCWRFGQTRPVTVDVVASEGEAGVAANLSRKAAAAGRMFAALVATMNDALRVGRGREYPNAVGVPAWLS